MRGFVGVVAIALTGALAASPALAQQNPIEGSWRTVNGTEVTITPCGAQYCGALTWVIVPPEYKTVCEADKAAFGQQLIDINNPDGALRTRPVVGMNILELTPNGSDFGGRAYDPTAGKTNEGLTVWLTDGGNTLRIGGGCIGHLCLGTQDWPRVPTRPVADFSCG